MSGTAIKSPSQIIIGPRSLQWCEFATKTNRSLEEISCWNSWISWKSWWRWWSHNLGVLFLTTMVEDESCREKSRSQEGKEEREKIGGILVILGLFREIQPLGLEGRLWSSNFTLKKYSHMRCTCVLGQTQSWVVVVG